MGYRQLTIDFDALATRETVVDFSCPGSMPETMVLPKDAFVARTRAIWDAVEAWLIDLTPAHGFDAFSLGVFDKITPEATGTFADADHVQSITKEYALAAGVAIAADEAAVMLEEHGHPDDASTIVRAYYFALALNTLDYNLEHYLPGMPVHALDL